MTILVFIICVVAGGNFGVAWAKEQYDIAFASALVLLISMHWIKSYGIKYIRAIFRLKRMKSYNC
jgi:hypothetical protein